MSLLTVIQSVCTELGLSSPSTVIGNTDPTVTQLLALSNREGSLFSKIRGQWSGWPELRKQYVFDMVTAGSFSSISMQQGSTLLTGFASVAGITAGTFGVSGGSILTGAMVTNVNSGALTVTIDTPAQSTVSGQTLTFGQVVYSLPSDLYAFIPQTEWDRNFRWQMLGPVSAQEWQTIVSGISPVGPRIRFRVINNNFWLQPPPGATQTDVMAFEYISNCWCSSAPGTLPPTQTAWQADTDVYAWPEEVNILGTKWRYLAAKGLNYAEEKSEWENARDLQISTSGTVRTLPMNSLGSGDIHLLGSQNIPDTGYGS